MGKQGEPDFASLQGGRWENPAGIKKEKNLRIAGAFKGNQMWIFLDDCCGRGRVKWGGKGEVMSQTWQKNQYDAGKRKRNQRYIKQHRDDYWKEKGGDWP